MAAVIAVDPGSEKCGLAVVDKDSGIVLRQVVSSADIFTRLRECMRRYRIQTVLIGNGTGGKTMKQRLENEEALQGISFFCVDEYRTTDLARKRYWQENPPRGWRRFLPVSLQVPPVPVDDYAAVIMAERYLQKT